MNEKIGKQNNEDEIDLYELLLVLKRRIRLIAVLVFISVLIATVVVFLKPNIYQARATVWVDSFLTPALIQSLQTVQSTEASKMSIIIPANSANINNLAISILSGLDFKRNIVKVLENKFGNLANIGLDNLDDKK